MNKAILIGNLTRDPELSETKDGISVCRFTVAVNRYIRAGETQTDFFNIVAWRGLGENVAKYCKKGSKVAVTGEIRIENYEDRDGNGKTAIKINANEIEFLSPSSSEKSSDINTGLQPPKTEKKAVLQPIDDDEDIPF